MANNAIVGMRDVHAILYSTRWNRPFTAFIQHGRSETGYKYEVVCPWCGATIGEFEESMQIDGPVEMSPREIATQCKEEQTMHDLKCSAGQFRMVVRPATRPLGTEGWPVQ